jgi:hypothetical protein
VENVSVPIVRNLFLISAGLLVTLERIGPSIPLTTWLFVRIFGRMLMANR